MHFGPDGKLYIAVGENANAANAQTLTNLLGKILRINRDGTIPTDNPFFSTATGNNRAIWALGLRNPFTFALQPETGRMFINDVGQTHVGGDQRRRRRRQLRLARAPRGRRAIPRFATRVYAYGARRLPSGCAITGGAFYPPLNAQFPADVRGDYFFADYLRRLRSRRLDLSGRQHAIDELRHRHRHAGRPGGRPTTAACTTFGARRRLGTTGVVIRVDYGGRRAGHHAASRPSQDRRRLGAPVTFTRAARVGTAPLSYQWRRNGANITGATALELHACPADAADNGARFSVIVTEQRRQR